MNEAISMVKFFSLVFKLFTMNGSNKNEIKKTE